MITGRGHFVFSVQKRSIEIDWKTTQKNVAQRLFYRCSAAIRNMGMSDQDGARRFFKLGLEAVDRGDLAAAESHFLQTLSILPNSIPTISNLLYCKAQQRKFADVSELANRVI